MTDSAGPTLAGPTLAGPSVASGGPDRAPENQ